MAHTVLVVAGPGRGLGCGQVFCDAGQSDGRGLGCGQDCRSADLSDGKGLGCGQDCCGAGQSDGRGRRGCGHPCEAEARYARVTQNMEINSEGRGGSTCV